MNGMGGLKKTKKKTFGGEEKVSDNFIQSVRFINRESEKKIEKIDEAKTSVTKRQ